MKHVVVDPITRIEGHLRIEMHIDESTGKVESAISSGTEWRGIELIMLDRDPRDGWAFVQRICGVCTSTHALAGLRVVEDALGITIPKNANYIRNIMHGTIDAHDHIVHFYHLQGFDFVSPVEALKADPAKAAALQNELLEKFTLAGIDPTFDGLDVDAFPKEYPKATTTFFVALKKKIEKIVKSGHLGIFSAQWWDHPNYQILPPEVHLMAISHYLNVLDQQRDIVIPHVVFGGKNPHPHYVVGGMPCSISLNDMNAPINAQRLSAVNTAIDKTVHLMNTYYLPDILAIASIYLKAGQTDGGGLSRHRCLAYGSYPDEPYTGISNGDYNKKCIVRCNGVVENFGQGWQQATFKNLEGPDFMNLDVLSEEVEHSWYQYPNGEKTLHPSVGVTKPEYTGPKVGTKTNWVELDQEKKYSWIKTPTFHGQPCEVGPLAKYIIVYTKVKQGIIKDPTWAEKMMVEQVDRVSNMLGLAPHQWLCSTIGRTVARCLDACVGAQMQKYFYNKLITNIKNGDTSVANMEKWDPKTWPKDCKGVGILDAPRGGLGHWAHIKDGRVANYQCIVPTTWNSSPLTIRGEHGAFEACMLDTRVAIPEKPLEVVRGIHSFDPCLACSTHIYDKKGDLVSSFNTDVMCDRKR